ncbi:TonB-dependent receptor domain-containing protein [Candidatus Contendibacter odensensis]|uniref:TonB-dependent receptor domain-containing protein n=1 Tax=Candidatus Contendibacter odensensis TaxID=1400860 RepID=UPI001E3F864B|nr:TonB-dependent receptor [Candidatus Contendobacter odensis]
MTPELNLQAEYRHRETDQGDLSLNFDGRFAPQDRNGVDQKTARIGARYSPSPQNSIIASFIDAERDQLLDFFNNGNEAQILSKAQSHQIEAQWLYKGNRFNTITGLSIYRTQTDDYYFGNLFLDFPTKQDNYYGYTNINFPENITWTLGLSAESYDLQNFSLNQLNPKLGLRWSITDQLVLRAAAFEVIKRDLVVNQTIEPTQLAGFNQFFDDANGTDSKNYGIGLDAHLSQKVWGGIELSRRDLEIPIGIGGPFEIEEDQEDLYRAYLYWLPSRNWSVTVEYLYEGFKMLDGQYRRTSFPTQLETTTVPLNVRYFSPLGFFAGAGVTYVDQRVNYDPEATATASGSDDFFLFDATVGYRLPKRYGIIALEARNLLDQQFQFQDYSFQTANNSTDPRFLPERTFLARIILNF